MVLRKTHDEFIDEGIEENEYAGEVGIDESDDFSAIMEDTIISDIDIDRHVPEEADEDADEDQSTFGFASVTSSITRETLAGESGRYSASRETTGANDVEGRGETGRFDFMSEGTKDQTDSDVSGVPPFNSPGGPSGGANRSASATKKAYYDEPDGARRRRRLFLIGGASSLWQPSS